MTSHRGAISAANQTTHREAKYTLNIYNVFISLTFFPQAMQRAGMVHTLRRLLADGGPRGRMYAAGALTILAGNNETALTAVLNTGSVLMLAKHYQGLTEFDFYAKDAIAMVGGCRGCIVRICSNHPPCIQALLRLSTCQALHQELVSTPEVLDVLLDLLLHGDECCRAHAAETVANLAMDEVGLNALAAGDRWVPALVELVRGLKRGGGARCTALHSGACWDGQLPAARVVGTAQRGGGQADDGRCTRCRSTAGV